MAKSEIRKNCKPTLQDRDLILLSRKFETYDLPKEKKYLLTYFDSELQLAFIKYYFVFGEYTNFTDHTGFAVQKKWLDNLYEKLLIIENAHKKAKSEFDMKGVLAIEKGKFKFMKHKSK